MQNYDALEFHDSEIASIGFRDEHLVVHFSAGYVHRSQGQAGINDGAGFLQHLELTCLQPIAVEQESGCIGRLADGELRINGAKLSLIPVPYASAASIELELCFANGAVCRVTAQGITLKPIGEARFVEWFKC